MAATTLPNERRALAANTPKKPQTKVLSPLAKNRPRAVENQAMVRIVATVVRPKGSRFFPDIILIP